MSQRRAPLILHIIFRLDYGGLENGLVNLVNRIQSERFSHGIACLTSHSDFRQRIRRSDIAVYSLDKRPGKDFGLYVRLWRLLRRIKPDIVHTRNIGTVDLQWLAWLAGVRGRVHSEHGWDAADPQGRSARGLIIRRACRRAIQHYVAVSRDLARWMEASVGIASARITQIYNGVDTEKFSGEGDVPDDVPWRNDGNSGRIVFGTVGRLDPIKNQRALLDAFATTMREIPAGAERLRLIVVGDGPLAAALRAQAADLAITDQVWFAGARNDIPALLRAMDVFVLPSRNEGISNTLLEAMAAQRPVIAARVGGNPELIEPGRTGELYDPSDARGLTQAMVEYCNEPSRVRAHGVAGRERAVRNFGLTAMVDRYTALYERLSAA